MAELLNEMCGFAGPEGTPDADKTGPFMGLHNLRVPAEMLETNIASQM